MKGDAILIHRRWMELLFDRQVNPHPVVGRETPNSEVTYLIHYIWSIIGIGVTIVTYPTFLTGLTVRKLFLNRISAFVDKYGIVVSMGILIVGWSILSLLSYSIGSTENAMAVVAASTVAVTSGLISYLSRKYFGRKTTLIFSYPSAYTAFLLPPVTFALIHSSAGAFVFELSSDIVISFKNIVAEPLGFRDLISETFDLIGINYLILWIGISTFLGWVTAFGVEVSRKIKS